VWKVIIEAIETSAGISGFGKGEARQKLGNSIALVAQSILMIKKKLCKINIGLILLSSNSSCSPQFSPIYNGKNTKLEFGLGSPFCCLIC
jgi:hypothetical protein